MSLKEGKKRNVPEAVTGERERERERERGLEMGWIPQNYDEAHTTLLLATELET